METLTAPPVAPILPAPEAPAEPIAPDAAPKRDRRVASPSTAKVKEAPLTGREIVEYVVMFVLGVLITVVTLWFYWLVQ